MPQQNSPVPRFNYYELVTPQKWRAGYSGEEGTPSYKPFYFPCGDCGEKDAVIKGFMGSGPEFFQIAVLDKGPGQAHLALFCETCFDKRQAENATEGLCPVCGEHVTLTGRTTDGRLIGSCRDAFTDAQWMEIVPPQPS